MSTEAYDLILLDIMMPFLGGWELLKELRSHSVTKNLPVALVTARASPRDDNQPYPTDYCD